MYTNSLKAFSVNEITFTIKALLFTPVIFNDICVIELRFITKTCFCTPTVLKDVSGSAFII